MKKIGVTGHRGRIGSRLVALGAVPLEFDVTDREAVGRELSAKNPDIVVHTASISSIARCAENLELAIQVNMRGTNIVCEMMSNLYGDGKVLFLSTEQVFDGVKGFYSEEDEPNPLNDYGRSKFAAEGVANQLYGAKTVRLSRGVSRESGKDIDTYINDLRQGKEIHVPGFIKRSYSHLDFLAEGVWYFAQNFESMPSLLHLGGGSPHSFCDFMFFMAEALDLNTDLVISRHTEIKDHARPFNCGFDTSLAESVGVPIYPIFNTIEKLAEEYEKLYS